jgi:hypothetical protein
MIDIKLPFWLAVGEVKKLAIAARSWWAQVEQWMTWPLTQMDPLTCQIDILDLLAWQRDIDRFPGEAESLYRLRVKHALINAQDAGSKAGFIAILSRLGIGYVEIDERAYDPDWDIVSLKLSDTQLANNPALLQHIVGKYGRTCRRYEFVGLTTISLNFDAKTTGHSWCLDVATL